MDNRNCVCIIVGMKTQTATRSVKIDERTYSDLRRLKKQFGWSHGYAMSAAVKLLKAKMKEANV